MNVRGIGWLVSLLLVVTACTPLKRRPTDAAPYFSSAEHQVMIMLRQSPSHYRPDVNYGGGYDARFGQAARRRTAATIAAEHHLELVADWPMTALDVDCFVMEAAADTSTARLVEQLSQDPRVESAQPVNLFHTLGHNDPLFSLQPTARPWHLDELHQVTTGRNVRVAVIDTGIDSTHPDLRDQVTAYVNFVDGKPYTAEDHGTAVAGIIAASADNGVGIVGVAPQARLLALRACWQESAGDATALCNSFTLAKALQFALDHNAQVINLSLGGPRDHLLERLLDVALTRKVTVVSAVDERLTDGGFPASHPGVLAVAGDMAASIGSKVIIAPGHDVPSTLPGGRWDFVTGSSFATAQVSGIVALLCQLSPRISPSRVRAALMPAPTTHAAAERAPLLNACAAVSRTTGTCACDCAVTREALSLHNL